MVVSFISYFLNWWGMTLAAAIVLVLLGYLFFSPGVRVRRLLRDHRFDRAYLLSVRTGKRRTVRDYLRSGLNLPSEALREPVLEVFDHLVNLDRSAADSRNRFVDKEFLETVREEVGRAFRALWETCFNLEIVGAQNVRFGPDHLKVLQVSERLGSLSEASEVARVKLAELSLGAGRENVEEAELALRIVGRQAEALTMSEES